MTRSLTTRIVRNVVLAVGMWWGVSALVVIAAAEEPLCCGNGPVDAQPVFILTAAKPGNAGNAGVAPVDLRAKMSTMSFKAGLNQLDSRGGLRLFGRYQNGKFVEYVMFDSKGNKVPSQTSRKVNAQGATTCWQCGKGDDGNTHCWVIPCPVIKGPWTPGNVKAARQ